MRSHRPRPTAGLRTAPPLRRMPGRLVGTNEGLREVPSAAMATPKGGRGDAEEAAAALGRLLDAVERGELDAPGSHGARLLRRMEGAVAGLVVAAPGRAAGDAATERRPSQDKGQ